MDKNVVHPRRVKVFYSSVLLMITDFLWNIHRFN